MKKEVSGKLKFAFMGFLVVLALIFVVQALQVENQGGFSVQTLSEGCNVRAGENGLLVCGSDDVDDADSSPSNEIQGVIGSQGLVRDGSNNFGLQTCTDGQILKRSGSTWVCAADAGGVVGAGSSNKVAFWTGTNTLGQNTNLHWDNTNERLGIGTSSPTEKLDVTGNVKVSSLNLANCDVKTVNGVLTCGTDAQGLISETDPQVGSVSDGKWCVANGTAVNCLSDAPSSGLWSSSANGGIYYNGGNVGIRTSNPLSLVDINVGGGGLLTMRGTGVFGIKLVSTGINPNVDIAEFAVNGATGEVRIGADYPSFYPTFYSGGLEGMRILPNGNVGIGTGVPTQKLDVAGSVNVGNSLCLGGVCRNSWPSGGAGGLSGYERVQRTSAGSSYGFVDCPAGKKVIGGGCSAQLNGFELGRSYPGSNEASWHCNYNGVGVDATAYAICVYP